MTDPRIEHAGREAEAWTRFETALGRIPRDRWEASEVLPGWSVRELLWHMTWWLEKCARNLERLRAGQEPLDAMETVDERNAMLAAEGRGMTAPAVEEGLRAARDLVRSGWEALPRVDDVAIEELACETYEHYDEHRADLERFTA